MSRTAKIIIGFFVFLVVVFGIASIAAQIYLAPFVKQQIEEKGSAALGAPIRVGKLSIGLFPPLTANASDVEFSAPQQGIKGKVDELSLRAKVGLSLDIKKAISDLKIRIIRPELTYDLSAKKLEEKMESSPPAHDSAAKSSPATDLAADIQIEDGRIKIVEVDKLKYLIEDFSLSTRFSGLSSPTKLLAQLKFSAPQILQSSKVPVVVSSEFSFDGTNLSTQATTIDLAQIKALLSGQQNIETGDGEWKLKAEARNFAANTKIADFSISGPVTGDLDAGLVFSKSSPSIRSLIFSADLSRAELGYGNLFRKPAAIPLIVDARGSTEGEFFKLDSAKIIFERLQAALSATIPLPTSKQNISTITFNFNRTALAGWENFFPALSKAPISGFIEGAGSFKGNLQDAKTYKITIKPLKLESIRAHLDWRSDDKTKTLRGPILLDGNVDLVATGSNLQSAKADLIVDLTKMQIEIKDVFSKPATTILRTELHATQKNLDEVELNNTALQLGTNQLVVSGTIRNPQQPNLNLNISAPKVSITELSKLLLALKKYSLTGQAQANLKLSGTYDFAGGIEKSPLLVSGKLAATIPSLNCPTPPEQKVSGVKPEAKSLPASSQTKPEPILPPWPIARSAVIESKVFIKQLNCKNIDMAAVAWNGQLNKGLLTGSVTAQNVFGGKLQVQSLKTNLAEAQPNTEATVKTQGVDVNKALTWFSPKWKNMLKGRLHGTNYFFVPDSSRADFLQKARAEGSVEIKNAFFSTLQLDQMINQALAKIPGFNKKEPVNSKGVAANINADYSFSDAVMKLKKFRFLSPDNNEIRATGTIDVAQNANLSGTAYLATAPVSGSIKAANSDQQGRLVLPFELKGNLMNPSVSFAEKTIQKLAENTAKKELDKLKVRAQEQGKKELEKKLEELKKNGLKGLFGK